jgi:hypothetical protein
MKTVARGETEPSVGIRLLLPPSCLELPGVVAEPPLALDVYALYIGGLRACSDPMRLAYLPPPLAYSCTIYTGLAHVAFAQSVVHTSRL